MDNSQSTETHQTPIVLVSSGQDRFSEKHSLGLTSIDFKVSTQDTFGNSFIIEIHVHERGGPALHLHYEQDEWFHVLKGEFVIVVGQEKFMLTAGDALLAPRKIPHTWARLGNSTGTLLIVFTPAGHMEDFFQEVSKTNAMPVQDPTLWQKYGMQLLGPPIALDDFPDPS